MLLPACLAAPPQDSPVKWSLTAPAQVLRPGGKFTVRLTAAIAGGWHLYSLKKLDGGPYPTSIAIPEGQPFRPAGEIQAPPPVTIRDDAFDMDVEMYFEEASFAIPVEVAPATAPGRATLAVTARYQVCDNKMCLPPKTVRSEAAIEIAGTPAR